MHYGPRIRRTGSKRLISSGEWPSGPTPKSPRRRGDKEQNNERILKVSPHFARTSSARLAPTWQRIIRNTLTLPSERLQTDN